MKMYIHTLKTLKTCFIFASVLALPAVVASAGQYSSQVDKSSLPPENDAIVGKLTRKTDSAISVAGQMILVSTATNIIKAGSIIRLEDLTVGDKVKVVVVKGEEGALQATSIEVLT